MEMRTLICVLLVCLLHGQSFAASLGIVQGKPLNLQKICTPRLNGRQMETEKITIGIGRLPNDLLKTRQPLQISFPA